MWNLSSQMLSHSRHFKLISADEYSRLTRELKALRDKQNSDAVKDEASDNRERQDDASRQPPSSTSNIVKPEAVNVPPPTPGAQDPPPAAKTLNVGVKKQKAKPVKSSHRDALSEDLILRQMPVKYRSRVRKVLSVARDKLRWSDKGELITDSGRLVKGSDICELLFEMASGKKSESTVKGSAEFTRILDKLYAPLAMSNVKERVKEKVKPYTPSSSSSSVVKVKDKSVVATTGVRNNISSGIKWAVL